MVGGADIPMIQKYRSTLNQQQQEVYGHMMHIYSSIQVWYLRGACTLVYGSTIITAIIHTNNMYAPCLYEYLTPPTKRERGYEKTSAWLTIYEVHIICIMHIPRVFSVHVRTYVHTLLCTAAVHKRSTGVSRVRGCSCVLRYTAVAVHIYDTTILRYLS